MECVHRTPRYQNSGQPPLACPGCPARRSVCLCCHRCGHLLRWGRGWWRPAPPSPSADISGPFSLDSPDRPCKSQPAQGCSPTSFPHAALPSLLLLTRLQTPVLHKAQGEGGAETQANEGVIGFAIFFFTKTKKQKLNKLLFKPSGFSDSVLGQPWDWPV